MPPMCRLRGIPLVLGRCPQRFILWLIVEMPFEGIDGEHGRHKAHLGAALQLLYAHTHVIHVKHCDTLEPLGVGSKNSPTQSL